MGYQQWWEILESLIAEFRKRQIVVPADVMTSLRSAKTMIYVYKADTARLESTPLIEGYLLDVESTLINTAKEKLGSAYAEEWLRKLDKARREEEAETPTTASRFISGLPRDEHWIRVLPMDSLLKEDVERMADEFKLSHETQKDGYILVHGNEEKVKLFVQKMAAKCRRTGEKLDPNV
jgi:hypothetical protein